MEETTNRCMERTRCPPVAGPFSFRSLSFPRLGFLVDLKSSELFQESPTCLRAPYRHRSSMGLVRWSRIFLVAL